MNVNIKACVLSVLQVLNLALSDFAFSLLVDPFTVYFELQPWGLSPAFCVTWMLLDAALPFVSFLVLILLNVDRLLFAASPSFYRRAFRSPVVRLGVVLLPWGVGLGVILPLWILTAVAWPEQGLCLYGITKKAAVTSAVVSLYLPCVALIILTVLVLVSIIGGMPQDTTEVSALRGPSHHPAGGSRLPYLTVTRPGAGNNSSVSSGLLRGMSQESGEERMSSSEGGGGGGGVGAGGSGGGFGGGAATGGGRGEGNVGVGRGGGVRGEDGAASAGAEDSRRGEGSSTGERPSMKKSHRRLVVALCVVNLVTVITQLPYGAISMLEPECVEPSCHSTIKLLQALSWMRSVTFTLQPLCLVALTRIRRACCLLCRRVVTLDPQNGGPATLTSLQPPLTPSVNTKSDQMEMTSVHAALDTANSKGLYTML